MKTTEVPQEESMLEGNRRACYAEDDAGRYVVVPSRGWAVEKIVNSQAIDQVRKTLENARLQVERGLASPLAYHMARCQMSVGLLAANSGIWRLRVRHHLKPAVFARLKPELLQRYADALGISVEALSTIPARAIGDSEASADGKSHGV